MTMTKLKIDLKSGTLDVEGAELFVKSIYEQFTTQMTSSNGNGAGVSSDQSTSKVVDGEDTKPKKTKKASPEKPTSSNYKPALDKNLDTSKLKEFVNNYELKNHSEKVLVFTKYLESINQIPCNFNQIYTCYVKAEMKVPNAFVQAIRDCSGKTFGYVEIDSSKHELTLTIAGNNYFNHDLPKKQKVDH